MQPLQAPATVFEAPLLGAPQPEAHAAGSSLAPRLAGRSLFVPISVRSTAVSQAAFPRAIADTRLQAAPPPQHSDGCGEGRSLCQSQPAWPLSVHWLDAESPPLPRSALCTAPAGTVTVRFPDTLPQLLPAHAAPWRPTVFPAAW